MVVMTSAKPAVVVLASGRGSNFEAIARAVREGLLSIEIRALVSDKPGAGALEKAKAWGIPAVAVARGAGMDRAAHDAAILAEIRKYAPRWLVLAGYMKILDAATLSEFDSGHGYSRVVNVHPSLLPAFAGVEAYAQAFRYGAKVTGVSVHLVDEGLDSGAICAQEPFAIGDCASEAEVESRGLAIEHRLYPETLAWVVRENFQVRRTETGRIRVRQS